MWRTNLVVGAAALALAGCASTNTGTDPSSEPTSDSPNGALFSLDWSDDVTITRYPLLADGSLGTASVLLSGPDDGDSFPGVVDAVGDLALTAQFTNYFSSSLELRDATTGESRAKIETDGWCGGEGLTFKVCVLLDDSRVVRTSSLGDPAEADRMVTVSSLADGSTIAEYGPFPGLYMVLGTSDPNTVMIVISPEADPSSGENPPGTVMSMDVSTGKTTEIGGHAADWAPLCAIGTDSVVGFRFDAEPTAEVVGPATVGTVTWAEDEAALGCSADGAFMYVHHYPQPPGEESEDTEAPNPPTTVDRISLADGTRDSVVVLDSGVAAGQVTR